MELLLAATSDALYFSLFNKRVVVRGSISRIGKVGTIFELEGDEPYSESVRHADHRQSLRGVIDFLQRNSHIRALRDITLVAHRFSHGGDHFLHPTLMNRREAQRLRQVEHLAADMPGSIALLECALSQLPSAQHVGVFDTALTATLPAEAKHYPLAPVFRTRFKLKRYGFHGIVHEEAYMRAQQLRKARRVVSVRIDHDVSVTALLDGIAVETTTGFTAAEGLPGMTRSGSLDPRIPLHLATHLGATSHQIDRLLSLKSGLSAMTGKRSYDELAAGVKARELRCVEALMLLSYRIAQAIAGMSASLGGIDMIIFSGEGASWLVLEEVCSRLQHFGVRLGKKRAGILSAPRSRVTVISFAISEEEAILRQAQTVVYGLRQKI